MKKKLLALVTVLFLTACSSTSITKEAAVYQIEKDNVKVTMTFDAKGDEIVFFHQKSTLNKDGIPDDVIKNFKTFAKESVADLKYYKGSKYSIKEKGNELIETIDIPINKDNLEKDEKYHLLNIKGDSDSGLSLSKSKEALEEAGWEKIK